MTKEYLNILWLSDIHFSESYADSSGTCNQHVNILVSGFLTSIKQYLKRSEKTIDYILLTGDIGDRGHPGDYELFQKEVLEKVKSICLKESGITPVILCIAGNHDLCRDDPSLFEEYLNALADGNRQKTLQDQIQNRNSYLLKESENFSQKQFGNYSQFFLSNFEKKTDWGICSSYESKGLFGWVVDHTNNAVFIFLNSTWFDTGSAFKSWFKNYCKVKYGKATYDDNKEFQDFLEMVPTIIERQGNQITGIELLKKCSPSVQDIIEQNQDKIIITCMHHPPSWLSQLEATPSAHLGQDSFLVDIFKNTDILLTGHLHLPQSVTPSVLFGNGLHFQAGAFMEHSYTKEEQRKKTESRFSIFEINTTKQKFKYFERQFRFSGNKWDKISKNEYGTQKKKVNLFDGRKNDLVTDLYARFDPASFFCDYFDSRIPISSYSKSELENYFCYQGKNEPKKLQRTILFPKKDKYFDEAFLNFHPRLPVPDFEKVLKGLDRNFQNTICFLWPDIFVIRDSFYDENESREDSLTKTINLAGSIFNRFRHKYYSQYNIQEIPEEFNFLRKISFTLQIIPFWQIVKYCK